MQSIASSIVLYVYISSVFNMCSIFQKFAGLLVDIKLHLLSTVPFSWVQTPWELWNPLSKAVPGKFHGTGGHSKCNCLQYWVRFRAWQIVLIFNTAITSFEFAENKFHCYWYFCKKKIISQWNIIHLRNVTSNNIDMTEVVLATMLYPW